MSGIKSISVLILVHLFFLSYSQDVAPNPALLKKYAGTYRMGVDGVKMTAESDMYVLTAAGKATWTVFTTTNPDGSVSKVPQKFNGTWNATEGNIQTSFNVGDDLISDYKWDGKVFRNGSIFLKKNVSPKTK